MLDAHAKRCTWDQTRHDETCPKAPTHCTHCHWLVEQRCKLREHIASVCPALTVKCSRCEVRYPRNERLLVHEPFCIQRSCFRAWRQVQAEQRATGSQAQLDEEEALRSIVEAYMLSATPNRTPKPSETTSAAKLNSEHGCGFPGCRVELNSLAPHALVRHRSLCPYRPVQCQLRCGARVASYLLASHLANECPHRVISKQ